MSKKSSPIIMVIVIAVAAAVGSIAAKTTVSSLFGGGDANIDSVLAKAADQINRNLPMMVDKNTRLDSTAALPGKKLLYHYTVMGIDPMPSGNELEAALKPNLINNYKTSVDMASLRDQDVILVYRYHDEAGSQVANFEVRTSDF